MRITKQSLRDWQVIGDDGRHLGWIERIGRAHYSLHIGFALSFHYSLREAKQQAAHRCAEYDAQEEMREAA